MKILYLGNMLSKHGKTPTSIETLGVRLSSFSEVIRYSEKKNKFLRLIDMMYACVKHRKDIDIALIDTYSKIGFYYAFFCAIVLHLFKIKYIPILRGGDLPHRLLTSPLLCKLTFGYSWINIAPSGYLLDQFSKSGFKVKLIPNYIDIKNYPYKHRSSISPKIMWVRSFHKVYRPEWAIEVVEGLIPYYPDIQLCMVGPDKDGSLEKCIQLVNNKDLKNHIKFTGHLPKQVWISESANYDIFLNTTSIDNTPVSVMEAMALGMVVVSTNVGGLPWILDHYKNGLLVNKATVASIVQEILFIIEHPDLAAKVSTQARKKAEEWDWEIVKDQWTALLK